VGPPSLVGAGPFPPLPPLGTACPVPREEAASRNMAGTAQPGVAGPRGEEVAVLPGPSRMLPAAALKALTNIGRGGVGE
jgi:hypothetical protein